MRIFIALVISILSVSQLSFATHNRAGEITYKKVVQDDPNDYQYEITIVTCTKASSQADRPWLQLRFGDEPLDAPLDSIQRIDADPPLESIVDPDNDFRINTYQIIHSYPGPGMYILEMEDPNRNGNVLNMDESISQVFFIESMLMINPFLGHNNSVSLLYPAKDEACVNAIWEHNPGAFDIDGDSLSYSLVACKGFMGLEIPSWVSPENIESSSGIDDTFNINPLTGTIMWETPAIAGEYNIAIRIEEYRNGILMGYVVRDMQILVLECDNQPPTVSIVQDTCVVAGEELEFSISASDANSLVSLSAIGAPMSELTNLAEFEGQSGNPANGDFSWIPDCEEVRPAAYQVLFVGEDSESNVTNLVDIMEVNITVIAPPVGNLTVEPNGLSFDLTWDEHECDEVIAYKIYKRSGAYGYEPSHCETGVPEYTGYEFLVQLDDPITSYNDSDNIDFGVESCYMIVACFANGSESIASEEICASIDLIIPVITKVSVGVTSETEGVDTINWSPPISEDTLLLTAPFKYRLYHSEAFNTAENIILETEEEAFISFLTSTFVHSGINTESTPNAYRVELVDALGQIVSSNPSSSTFLNITPNDNELLLSWDYSVSWQNTLFNIYKWSDSLDAFEFLSSTTENSYTDTALVNNVTYCYYVEALGTFNSDISSLPDPTYNLSQEVCAFPVDLTPPCPPEINAFGSCEEATISLTWENQNGICADDITGYNVYFKPFIDSEYVLLDVLNSADDVSFDYVNPENITGCLYVTAVDSLLPGIAGELNQNESVPSAEFCFESCPDYQIPNIITPQGDGMNDFFKPFPYSYVDSIDLVIYNRWGTTVFETKDADILWDGLHKDSGEIISEGVYFYTLSIYTSKLTGVVEEKRIGNFTVLDTRKNGDN